jgi:hypothetical protein
MKKCPASVSEKCSPEVQKKSRFDLLLSGFILSFSEPIGLSLEHHHVGVMDFT